MWNGGDPVLVTINVQLSLVGVKTGLQLFRSGTSTTRRPRYMQVIWLFDSSSSSSSSIKTMRRDER